MDPLTAFSVAGTVIQFADFGIKLLSEAHHLYTSSSGALEANKQLELVTSDLHAILPKLGVFSKLGHDEALHSNEESEDSLKRICDKASAISRALIDRLERLKVDDAIKGNHRVWTSVHKAVESAWTKKEREELERQLKDLKDALETRVLISFRAKFDLFAINASERFNDLDKQTKIIVSALSADQKLVENRLLYEVAEKTSTLAMFLSRLQVNNTEEHRKTRAMIAGIKKGDVIPIIEVFGVSPNKEAELQRSVGEAILKSLRYESMSVRYEDVADAHQDTFGWIFDEPTNSEQSNTCASFLEWLRHGDGLYWIKGKPGSGKSTLMKSIYDDPRLRQNLDGWASISPLSFASFFFWNSVLNENPELIPVILPLQWARTYSRLALSKFGLMNENWGLKPLMDGFRTLTQQELIKLCLLIDGLDEFEGDHEELTELCLNATSSNVKICVSSRPWNVFEDCFGSCPGLLLQDLTRADIQCFVEDKLTKSLLFQRLSERDPTSAASFVEEIVAKASGVFLWVMLVVKSLLKGMRNRDAVADLQWQLRQLPPDLKKLFRHHLTVIESEPGHLKWASKAFQIFRASQEYEKNVKDQNFTTSPMEAPPPLTIWSLYLALDEEITPGDSKRWTRDERENACQDATSHLNARCAGLLEVNHGNGNNKLGSHSQIRYLHRTARDFLMQPDVWNDLVSHTPVKDFNPEVSLFKSYVLHFSFSPAQSMYSGIWWYAHHALMYAVRAESQTCKAPVGLLDTLDLVMIRERKSLSIENTSLFWGQNFKVEIANIPQLSCFLQVAVIYGLTSYVERKLIVNPKLLQSSPASILHYGFPDQARLRMSPHLAMIQVLLKAGGDPNDDSIKGSPWQRALLYALSVFQHGQGRRGSKQEVLQILATLLEAGADPHIPILKMGLNQDRPFTVNNVLQRAKTDGDVCLRDKNGHPFGVEEIEILSNAIDQAFGRVREVAAIVPIVGHSSSPGAMSGNDARKLGPVRTNHRAASRNLRDDHQNSKKKRFGAWIKRMGS